MKIIIYVIILGSIVLTNNVFAVVVTKTTLLPKTTTLGNSYDVQYTFLLDAGEATYIEVTH